jgi:hypothetical protein
MKTYVASNQKTSTKEESPGLNSMQGEVWEEEPVFGQMEEDDHLRELRLLHIHRLKGRQ